MIVLVKCPELYEALRERDPKQFVEFCKLFIKANYHGRKAIAVERSGSHHNIVTIPDFSAVRPIVKGKGKTKQIERVRMWDKPPESYFTEEQIDYLRKKGMNVHGDKTDPK